MQNLQLHDKLHNGFFIVRKLDVSCTVFSSQALFQINYLINDSTPLNTMQYTIPHDYVSIIQNL